MMNETLILLQELKFLKEQSTDPELSKKKKSRRNQVLKRRVMRKVRQMTLKDDISQLIRANQSAVSIASK